MEDKNIYVKSVWEEEQITMYFHYENEEAVVRQIEISPKGVFLTSLDEPFDGESMLCDKGLDRNYLEEEEIISKEEFEEAWIKYKKKE